MPSTQPHLRADASPVFVSYCRADAAFVLRLTGDLKAGGANVWVDQLELAPGERWDAAIQAALSSAARILVVLSPAAVRSTNVMDEASFALDEGKIIIPVIYQECVIPFRLRRLQHVDFRQDHDGPLKSLLKTLTDRDSKAASEVSADDGAATPNPAPILPPLAETRVIDGIREEAARVVQTFVNVLTKREKALDGLVLTDAQTLSFALRFLVYMAFVSLVLHLPAWAVQKINLNSPGPVLAFLTEDLVEKLTLCIILHVALRRVGGTGDLRESVCAFCFLCAFAPLIAVSLIPSQTLTGSLLLNSSSAADFLERLSRAGAGTAAGDLATFAISFTLSTILSLIFLTSVFKAYRTVHRLRRARAAAAFVTGAAAWMVIQFVLLYPFQAAMYKGFSVD